MLTPVLKCTTPAKPLFYAAFDHDDFIQIYQNAMQWTKCGLFTTIIRVIVCIWCVCEFSMAWEIVFILIVTLSAIVFRIYSNQQTEWYVNKNAYQFGQKYSSFWLSTAAQVISIVLLCVAYYINEHTTEWSDISVYVLIIVLLFLAGYIFDIYYRLVHNAVSKEQYKDGGVLKCVDNDGVYIYENGEEVELARLVYSDI